MRARLSATIAVLLLALLSPLPAARAAASDGVGISTNGLLFYYDSANYYGSVDSTHLRDLSGNGLTATINQTSSQPSVSTSNGGYLSFNASGGYLSGTSMSSITNSFSLSFYANFGTQANNFERIIDFGNGAANNNLEVGREGTGTNLFIEMFNGGTSPGYCRANGAIDSSWHHWVVSVSGGLCNVYKDNSRIVTDAAYSGTVASTTWSNMYIGKSNWVADAAFEGGIGELAFYNRALTGSEVTQNYNAAMDQTAPTYSGLSSYSPNEGQTSVTTLTASESGTFIPTAGSGNNDKFTLTGSTLTFTSTPNYEAPNPTNILTYVFKMMDLNGNVSAGYSIIVSVQDVVEPATLTVPTLSATPYKGISVTITVTPAGDGTSIPGKITYLMAGKRILNCYKKSYSGSGNSTCSWKPTTMGAREITVTFTPTNTSFTAATIKKTFQVFKRTTTR
ncbi:MAG: putative amino-acid transporter-binding protein YhdW [Actinomycetota bacterium]